MHKVQTNYSNCIARSNENICNSSGEALRKSERQDETPFCEFQSPLNDNVLFLQLLLKFHPVYDQT
jgi:hypothetical protein